MFPLQKEQGKLSSNHTVVVQQSVICFVNTLLLVLVIVLTLLFAPGSPQVFCGAFHYSK